MVQRFIEARLIEYIYLQYALGYVSPIFLLTDSLYHYFHFANCILLFPLLPVPPIVSLLFKPA